MNCSNVPSESLKIQEENDVNKIDSAEAFLGNTSKKARVISPAKCWIFTLNNYTDHDKEMFSSIVPEFCTKCIIGLEVGESGTPHFQGILEFKTKSRPMSVFKYTDRISWKLKNKQPFQVGVDYCAKGEQKHKEWEEHNINGPEWGLNRDIFLKIGCDWSKVKYIPTIKIIEELRPFQADILKMLLGPVNENKVIWVYDKRGQLGKSELLRYLYVKYKMPFSYGGKASDIVNLVFNHKEYLLENDKAVMIYNFGRDTDNEKISYKSMEQISDGCISNTKFETGCFVCNKPHVLVLANCLPKREALTKSRWIVKTINRKMELINYDSPKDEDCFENITFNCDTE